MFKNRACGAEQRVARVTGQLTVDRRSTHEVSRQTFWRRRYVSCACNMTNYRTTSCIHTSFFWAPSPLEILGKTQDFRRETQETARHIQFSMCTSLLLTHRELPILLAACRFYCLPDSNETGGLIVINVTWSHFTESIHLANNKLKNGTSSTSTSAAVGNKFQPSTCHLTKKQELSKHRLATPLHAYV